MSADVTNDRAASNIFSAFFKGLRNYFNFRGRTCRYDYLAYILVVCLVSFLFNIAAISVSGLRGVIVVMVVRLLLYFSVLSIFVRRLHDVNKSVFKWCGLPLAICLGLWCAFIFVFRFVFEFRGAFHNGLYAIMIGLYVCFFWFLTSFIFTCQKGKPEDNKYGKSIIEDESHDKKSVLMILFLFFFVSLMPYLTLLKAVF